MEMETEMVMGTAETETVVPSRRGTRVVILLCVTGLARVSLVMASWVQLGGKYAGKPCAKQPGQTTKPKCGSSKMKRALSKDEEEAAFRRKNRQDPNPDRKGKAINVKTEETLPEATYPSDFKKGSGVAKKKYDRPKQHDQETDRYGRRKTVDEGKKDACYHKVKSRYSVWPSAYASGALVKCRKVGAANWETRQRKKNFQIGEQNSLRVVRSAGRDIRK